MPTWTVENTWNCSSCSQTQKGRYTRCQNCGSPKEKGETDTINPNAAPVTDAALLRQAAEARHEVCPYCHTKLRESDRSCPSCAGGRHSKTAPKRAPEPRQEAPRPVPDPTPVRPSQRLVANDSTDVPKVGTVVPNKGKILGIIGGVLGLAGLLSLCLYLFTPSEVSGRVVTRSWNVVSVLRERVTLHGTGWDETVKGGAFNVSCVRKYKGQERCNPHNCNPHQQSYSCRPHDCNCYTTPTSCRDNGNGFSTCSGGDRRCSTCYDTCYRTVYDTCWDSCPVYDQWCEYDYYEWPQKDRKQTHGVDDTPVLPDLAAVGPLQRVDVTQTFAVSLTGKYHGDVQIWNLTPTTLEEYNTYPVGATWSLKVNRFGKCEPIKRLTAEAE